MCETAKSANVKIIDFGLSSILNPKVPVKVTMATADFAAPEVADHEPVGFYTDMWSVGVIAYALCALAPLTSRLIHSLTNTRILNYYCIQVL